MSAPTGRPNGRPSSYTEERGNRICAELAAGRSLVAICDEEWAPDYKTVLSWLQKEDGFLPKYERAREFQADFLADEIVSIADGADGESAEAVAKARLRVDARKWVAAKLKPKKYGDKLDVEHGGTIGHAHMTLDQFRERMAKAVKSSEPKAIEDDTQE